MKNDLISRNDLINTKPEFMNEKVVRDTKYRTTKERIYAKAWNACNRYWLNTIKNAPTVVPDNDIFEWCTDCKEYDQEKHCCHRWSSKIREAVEEVKQCKLDELRPKGEWITTRTLEHDGEPYCSNCNEETIIRYRFCPNCGADMRGKEE